MSVKNHKALCHICNHKERKEIEYDFINGYSIAELLIKYDIERYSFERHLKRFPKIREDRSANVVKHLDRFLEHSSIGKFHIDSPDFLKAEALKLEQMGIIKRGTVVNNTQSVTVVEVEKARDNNVKSGLNRFGYALQTEDIEK